jgi:hypothetical protein
VRSSKTTALTLVPLSGDRFIDWTFKQFVIFLRRETLHIKRKRNVYSEDKHREKLRGLMLPKDEACSQFDILISADPEKHANRDEELSTLVHELCHIVFWKTNERYVRQAERILFEELTQEQKNYLKSFIPRHEVKSV